MIKAINLKTEYLQNPLGIDIVRPRFMWNVDGAVKQTAYQIIAKVNGKTVWNSGKVESSAMTHIPYGGSELHSRERVNWSVKLWDENGNGGEISHSFSEMGLPNASDWKAKWITGNYKVKKNERYPVDCFRKKLSVTRSVIADNPPNFGDADSVLGSLYECFNENNPYDNEQIKTDFNELY